MPAHELLRQVKAKSLSVKIPKNEPNTARLSWVLANEEFLTVEIPRYALERFMVQAKRAIEETPLSHSGAFERVAVQEGYYGVGHDKWHQGFYSRLKRNNGQGSCCNLMDCRPTQSRMVGDHYEVKVDGAWTPVPYDKINNVVAPDGAL